MGLSNVAALDRVLRTGDWPTEVLSVLPARRAPRAPRVRRPPARHRAQRAPLRPDWTRIRQDAYLVLSCSCSSYVAGYLVASWT